MMPSVKCILSTLVAASFTLAVPTNSHEAVQQPIFHPNDNFTLTPIRDALVSNKIIGDVLNDFEPSFYLDVFYPASHTRVSLGTELTPEDVAIRPSFAIYDIPDRNKPPKASRPAVFTLILTDPDALSRYNPTKSEMCHWIVTNLTSTSGSGKGDFFQGGIELKLDEDLIFDHDDNNHDEEVLKKKKNKNKKRKNKDKKNKKKKKKHGSKERTGSCHKDKKGGPCLSGELVSYFPPGPPPKTGWHRYVFVLLEGDASHLLRPASRTHWGYGSARRGIRDWAIESGLTVVGANFFFAENLIQ